MSGIIYIRKIMKYRLYNICAWVMAMVVVGIFFVQPTHADGDPSHTVVVSVDGIPTQGITVCRAQEGAIDPGDSGEIPPAEWCATTGVGGAFTFADDAHQHGNWGCRARNHMIYVKDARFRCTAGRSGCFPALPGMANPRSDACYLGVYPRMKGNDTFADSGSYYKIMNDGARKTVSINCTSLVTPTDIPPNDLPTPLSNPTVVATQPPPTSSNSDQSCIGRECGCSDAPCASNDCNGGVCDGAQCTSCQPTDPGACVVGETLCSKNEYCGNGGICGYDGVCRSCAPLNCAPCP